MADRITPGGQPMTSPHAKSLNRNPTPTGASETRGPKSVRIMRGLTQTQLGERLGISFQQVQKYEKGTNRIGSSRLWDMGGILDVTVTFFFEGLGGDHGDDEKISRRALQLAKELDRIEDEDVKASFLQLLRVYNAPGHLEALTPIAAE